MPGKKVYLVTVGVYSDYRVDRVFSEKEMAEAFVAKMNDTESARRFESYRYGVEEYELDAELPYPLDMFIFYVEMWLHSGDVIKVKKEQEGDYERRGYAFDKDQKFGTYVLAKTEEQAVKIANERRAAHLSALCIKDDI